MKQVDVILVALAGACVFVILLGDLGLISLAGAMPIALHRYYIVAVALGWFFGNVYVARSRRDTSSRVFYLATYGMCPIPPLFALWAMTSRAAQQAAPLVPLFATAMFAVFFVVPVSLRRTARQRVRIDREASKVGSESATDGRHREDTESSSHPGTAAGSNTVR